MTTYLPTGEQMSVYEAAGKYQDDGTPLVVLAGAEYGPAPPATGPPKAPTSGIRAVIATSYERIHRSNCRHGRLPCNSARAKSRLAGPRRIRVLRHFPFR
ncbi:MAG: hypothetical protein Ct9H300mP1_38230 [Planctomycetaceae bacterium]|nr:MAG: hypothetical protein Ct9H300mP1_38230 [Planctomycetaceae bacterium]